MNLTGAREILGRMLDPMPVTQFLDENVSKRFIKLDGAASHFPRAVLGDTPEAVILDAFEDLSGKITWHADKPSGPAPAVLRRDSAAAFREQIGAFHANLYTVRIPDVRPLTPQLDEFCRALELIFQTEVAATAFWSRGDGAAPVHHDDHDIIAIQLRGQKKWFVSADPPSLSNNWKHIPEGPPRMDREIPVEMKTGDLLYLPRGTTHRVEGIEDSVHVSIGFTPVTMRDAVIACIDHLSDIVKPLREMTDPHIAVQVQTGDFGKLGDRVRQSLALLAEYCRTDQFIADAMQRRSSRAIGELKRLDAPKVVAGLTADTRLRHNRMAISHLSGNARLIDFAYPGGHRYIHRGAEAAVTFIAQTPEFAIRDLPGNLDMAIRIALVDELVTNGFLEVAGGAG